MDRIVTTVVTRLSVIAIVAGVLTIVTVACS